MRDHGAQDRGRLWRGLTVHQETTMESPSIDFDQREPQQYTRDRERRRFSGLQREPASGPLQGKAILSHKATGEDKAGAFTLEPQPERPPTARQPPVVAP